MVNILLFTFRKQSKSVLYLFTNESIDVGIVNTLSTSVKVYVNMRCNDDIYDE
jgi:hypothetical protein